MFMFRLLEKASSDFIFSTGNGSLVPDPDDPGYGRMMV